MHLKVDYKAMCEVLKAQRNAALDDVAALTTAVRSMQTELQRRDAIAQPAAPMWTHDCPMEHSEMKVAAGEACNWCGAKEEAKAE